MSQSVQRISCPLAARLIATSSAFCKQSEQQRSRSLTAQTRFNSFPIPDRARLMFPKLTQRIPQGPATFFMEHSASTMRLAVSLSRLCAKPQASRRSHAAIVGLGNGCRATRSADPGSSPRKSLRNRRSPLAGGPNPLRAVIDVEVIGAQEPN